MGYLYAHLFHVQLQHYFPFLIAGMLTWTLISTIITEITDTFITSDNLIKQIKMPYTLHIHRIACRNLIIFFHNIIVFVPILVIYHDYIQINSFTLLFLPGLAVLYVNTISYGLLFAMLGARFRDISPIIRSLVQVIFFITPVMWSPDILKEHNRYIAEVNPIYSFLELVRAPLLGHAPSFANLLMVTVMTVIGILISAHMFIRFRARIIYWL
jgi:ABC-type polysaccharide/polyol phosphate export permease